MSKKTANKAENVKDQVANVPNPPVPNRAHTEMKNQHGNATNKAENKKN